MRAGTSNAEAAGSAVHDEPLSESGEWAGSGDGRRVDMTGRYSGSLEETGKMAKTTSGPGGFLQAMREWLPAMKVGDGTRSCRAMSHSLAVLAGSELSARPVEHLRGKAGNDNMKITFAALTFFIFVFSFMPTSLIAGDGHDGNWTWGQGCDSSKRVPHGQSDCIHAWWDNTPHWTSGHAGGSTYGVRNYCADYGKVTAHANVTGVGGTDTHIHMGRNKKYRGYFDDLDISGISCCIDKSDLCHKQQAEPEDGHILVWSGTGTTTESRNVSYHGLRYVFCRDNPNNVYCENDPEGDAFDTPTLMCGEGDDRAECDADDCERLFEANTGPGRFCTLDSASYDDAHCTLDVSCSVTYDNGTVDSFTQEDIRVYLRDIKDKLRMCGSTDRGYSIYHENDGCPVSN